MASRKKPSNAARKRDGIHFVNARPASETERLKAQRLVRAHVGRWISDQTKDRANPGSASASASSSSSSSSSSRPPPGAARRTIRDSVSPLSSASTSSSSSSDHVSPSSYPLVSRPAPYASRRAIAAVPGLPRPPREWQRSPFPPSHASDSSDSSSDDSSSVTDFSKEPTAVVPWKKPACIEPQISGFLDPFDTLPSKFSPEVVNLSETYCISVIWPGLIPKPGKLKKTGETWFPLSLSDPALFTAFMYGSLCHQRVQWLKHWVPDSTFGPQQQRVLQLCEMESIKLINQAVRDPTRAISDAVLLSVICMAHHQALEASPAQNRNTPFKAPFQRLQWLDVYGHLPPNMIHIRGLVQLVKLRGGLQNIKLDGLRATITFSAIMTASCLCMPPGFEFCALDESRTSMSIQELLGFGPSDIEHGFGRLQGIGITSQMAEAMQAIRAYINIVGACLVSPYDTSLLADQRNLTQYTLLSVPPAADISTTFSHPSHEAIYEACRIAMLIFSVGVVFPIPANNTPLPRLAQQLQSVLCQPNASVLWSSSSTRVVLIWILSLGGIAAFENATERTFFVTALRDTTRRSGLSSWEDVKRALSMMLWFDLACDEAGENMFYEATESCLIE
ncbi:hypothetical protein N7462_000109 [Penicillium macrosclerotiorum]|uniref:uncharacterized protein n=1 Tax=Penicillium macrosclerotiorum TaxID=303699 RepID=UPI002548E476|nr:uncharacterized protein N7462_000109 [Penicillium macrosclerotiorum]KAJ5698104.1 hypothetical protein N7462_000109 [Penicillium macrosclerotiorum]